MPVNLSTLLGNSFYLGPLNGLSDVVINAPGTNDVLMYDGATWTNDPTINTDLLTPLQRQQGVLTLVPISVTSTTPSTTPEVGDLWVDIS